MSKKLSIITLITFVCGIVLGVLWPTAATSIKPLGDVYINLLKVMIVPVLFTSIVNALMSGKNKKTGSITLKTILLFIIMYCVSFMLCFGLYSVIKPGKLFTFTEVSYETTISSTTFGDFLVNLFPQNIISAMSNNSILPVILFGFIFAFAANKLTNKNNIKNLFIELTDTFNTMLKWIMYFTPIGVFALIANTVATYGSVVLGTGLTYILMAYLGCLLITLLVMILPAWIWGKVNPITYIKKVAQVWLITLSTRSSAATLPTTIRVCNEEFNVPKEITNLVVPLGCTIHMCGGAVSFCLLALFNLQMYNIPLTLGIFVLMLLVSLLLNMGAPGIPGGGIIIGTTFLSILGLPLNFIGFYAGIYTILDMAYTTMNVTGDITANILINKLY